MLKKKYYTAVQIHEAIDGVVDYSKHMEIYRRLAQMETEDVPERKVGKWIDYGVDLWCSECGCRIDKCQISDYCPECGAKMAGKEQKSYADWELRRE